MIQKKMLYLKILEWNAYLELNDNAQKTFF